MSVHKIAQRVKKKADQTQSVHGVHHLMQLGVDMSKFIREVKGGQEAIENQGKRVIREVKQELKEMC